MKNKITRKNIRGEFFPNVKKDFYKHEYRFELVEGGFICNATRFFVANKKVVRAETETTHKEISPSSIRWHNELQRAIRMVWGNRGLRNQLFGL
ncbi:hypothetical protein [Fusobacterium necrophorum]|uniref:hypothetical protein n=1 Tax=Fusobacterium necrophorum TaxID=859 RepID=UPI001B8C8B9E|nr:hypothetical protein [Fusobacterium necrophorum]MBR8733082.1 hypothetical protein [Fusobacterium necrophorum]MBR8789374.1 hypothetical protein [Fusobacterium necrophorum]